MKQLLAWCVVIVSCGCSAVYSPTPIGDRPTDIQANRGEWEGTWMHADGAMTVKVMDGTNGVLKVGWIEGGMNDLKVETEDVYLRDGGGWTFASIKPREETNQNRYVWARIKKEERTAILWWPDGEKFKALVQSGGLPGSVDGSDVFLGHLSSNQLRQITSQTNGVLLNWEDPLVLFKTGK